MAGLVPAIHVLLRELKDVDAPPKSDVSDLGQYDFAEVGNTRLRMTSAGMTVENMIQSERNAL